MFAIKKKRPHVLAKCARDKTQVDVLKIIGLGQCTKNDCSKYLSTDERKVTAHASSNFEHARFGSAQPSSNIAKQKIVNAQASSNFAHDRIIFAHARTNAA